MNELDFAQFFKDVHGRKPFPWQERLTRELTETHAWPDLIDLPTASGKTACIDIALFHLAWCAAHHQPWLAARRIVFVVDRRIIVDAAAERAKLLQRELENPKTEAIAKVASALKELGGSKPLECEKLRGGMPRERGLALSPAQPMVITSTVDQIGSRLLFRGYGVNPYSYPIHAGLLGYDTLLLVDEAHLSQPFIETIAAIRTYQGRAEKSIGQVQPLKVVPLSATSSTEATRFKLDEKDFENEDLHDRYTAPKPARLVKVSSKQSERIKALVAETLAIVSAIDAPAPAIAVVVNRVRTARAVYEQLAEASVTKGLDIELMIGRARPLDRDVTARRIVERAGVGQSKVRTKGVIVVATQTIEVGADLDFHALVTECAALDALRQRFGRLDRLGKYRKARAVIAGDDSDDEDPVYGPALSKTWSWLRDVARVQDGDRIVDFSIESMERLTSGQELRELASPVREQLVLTPLDVELLCQTSPVPMYSPDIPALLHGLGASAPDVQVIWRADLPLSNDELHLDESRVGVAAELLELNPPMSLEALPLPAASVRAWLRGTGKEEPILADVEGVALADSDSTSERLRCVLRRVNGKWSRAEAGDIRPGDTIVVPCTYGGCDEFGFAPSSVRPVPDLSAVARSILKKSALVVVTKKWLENFGLDSEVAKQLWQEVSEDQEQQFPPEDTLAKLLESISSILPTELSWLRSQPIVEVIHNPDGTLFALVVIERRVHLGDISDEDLSSSQTVPIELHQHNAGVAEHARKLAKASFLDTEHIRHLELAAQLHDIGKADPRFQRLLRSGSVTILPGKLLAKGFRSSRDGSAEPAERHEAYSVAFVDQNSDLLDDVADRELVRYLIGVHHGRGRALMPDRRDEGTTFAIQIEKKSYSFDGVPRLGSLDSGWPSAFWRLNHRYGPWGLAYLEATLRLADWLRSAEELEMEQRA